MARLLVTFLALASCAVTVEAECGNDAHCFTANLDERFSCDDRFCCDSTQCKQWEHQHTRKKCLLERDKCKHPVRHYYANYKCISSALVTVHQVASSVLKSMDGLRFTSACRAPNSTSLELRQAREAMKFECVRAWWGLFANIFGGLVQVYKMFVDCMKWSIIWDGDLENQVKMGMWRKKACGHAYADMAVGITDMPLDSLTAASTCQFPDEYKLPIAAELALPANVTALSVEATADALEWLMNLGVFGFVKQCYQQGGFGFSDTNEMKMWDTTKTSDDSTALLQVSGRVNQSVTDPRPDKMGRNVYALCRKYTISILEFLLGMVSASLYASSAGGKYHEKHKLCTASVMSLLRNIARFAKSGVYVANEYCAIWTPLNIETATVFAPQKKRASATETQASEASAEESQALQASAEESQDLAAPTEESQDSED